MGCIFCTMKELNWVANYADGTKLEKFAPSGGEHRYQDIDRDKLVRFDLIDPQTNKAVYSLYLHDGQRLIYRARTLVNVARNIELGRVRVYLVGWQERIMTQNGPRTVTAINYIHEDGSISLDDHRSNLELLPEEA